ncbi:MAG: tetratricopeptide repeat protein, partial [Armatimonadetes bacterium]|nr:tetratricopeptide repeat protein [Armatimonadota bacterium]
MAQPLGVSSLRWMAAVIVLVAAACFGAEPKPADSTSGVLRQARQLVAAEKLDDAIALLSDALKRFPTDPELHNNLGYVFELQNRVDDAVEHYAAALTFAPSNRYASERLESIFYGERFPSRLRLEHLAALPVRFARLQVVGPDGMPRQAAVTVSAMYPAEMRHTSGPVRRVVPPGVDRGEVCQFNRVVYVFVQRDATDSTLARATDVYYPSEILSRDGRDYGPLALSLARIAARFHVYLACWPGLPARQGPVRVWLCEGGPAGGGHDNGDVYLYQVAALRPGEEWLRELAHEIGHALLPPLAGYARPEHSIAGLVGEAWLLSALAFEAEQTQRQVWSSAQGLAWLQGLWPLGVLDLEGYVRKQVGGCVKQWVARGPYDAGEADSPQAAQVACGFLLWLQAAHGTNGLGYVAQAGTGTLAGLTARYRGWMGQSEEPLKLRAAAGFSQDFASDWLPFGQRRVAFTRQQPWRTICYLPAGVWRISCDAGAELLATWRPVGRDATSTELAPRVTSQGEWGWLEAVPASEEQVAASEFVL